MKNFISLIFTFCVFSIASYSQYTGATPWANCFGKNASCSYYGCSDITVKTSTSPVIAIVKHNGKVKKHAYIASSSSYTFEVPNGTYQVFFYSGTSWNTYKSMDSDECYNIKGGFTSNENVTKDDPVSLHNQVVVYTLTYSTGGNFSPRSSNIKEAL